jgi:hypothetical protein
MTLIAFKNSRGPETTLAQTKNQAQDHQTLKHVLSDSQTIEGEGDVFWNAPS